MMNWMGVRTPGDHHRLGRPLRLAVVTETYPPEVNGVALSLQRLVVELIRRGHTVQLVRPRQRSEGTPQASGPEVMLTRGLPIPRYPGLRFGLPARRRLRAAWTRCRPDLVHIATEGPLGWSAIGAASDLAVPVVSEFRTNFDAYGRHYGIGSLSRPIAAWLRHVHNRTACTMVPTRSLAAGLQRGGYRNLAVAGRGVDCAQFGPGFRCAALRRSWGAGDETPVALYVGRVAAEKNLDLLVGAWKAMRLENPLWRLVVVGDGPARESLARGCPDIRFAGMRRGQDLATHVASGDLLVFPSVTETFGNVVLEAMASGLAVLAFHHAAAGELIRHGENGWLAPWDDPGRFVELARGAARDPLRVRRLGVEAHRTARQHGWAEVASVVEGVYRGVLNGWATASQGEVSLRTAVAS